MAAVDSPHPTFPEALAVWAKIGVLSFGGPAGQIALMHRMLVDERRWISEDRFLHALNFCMLLPGPEAMQLATYIGWRLHGTLGGLAAGLLFVLPGAFVVLALSIAYAYFGQVPIIQAAFVGIKAAVLVIVIEALLKVARRALRGRYDAAIAAAAFIAIFFFAVPFPLIVAAAAAIGFFFHQMTPPHDEPTTRRRASRHARANASDCGAVAHNLDRSASRDRGTLGPRPCDDRHRSVLLQARRCHVRRGLCRSRLYGAAGGRDLWLAERKRDARSVSDSPRRRPVRLSW